MSGKKINKEPLTRAVKASTHARRAFQAGIEKNLLYRLAHIKSVYRQKNKYQYTF